MSKTRSKAIGALIGHIYKECLRRDIPRFEKLDALISDFDEMSHEDFLEKYKPKKR